MSDWMGNDRAGPDGLGIDRELAQALRSLDPATQDPNYWFRFRGWVMTRAAPELARRRVMARLTMGDVMSSWARAVVPTAVLAAARAAMDEKDTRRAGSPPSSFTRRSAIRLSVSASKALRARNRRSEPSNVRAWLATAACMLSP